MAYEDGEKDGYSENWERDLTEPSPTDIDRLVFLLAERRIELPKIVADGLPFGAKLRELSGGVGTAEQIEALWPMYQQGRMLGEGSISEVIAIIHRLAKGRISDWAGPRTIKFYRGLSDMENIDSDPFATDYQEVDMEQALEGAGEELIPKYFTGYEPFDAISGEGFYQGLVVMQAMPGSGKTSNLISLAENLVSRNIPVWFFENEIAGKVMAGRVSVAARRENKMLDKEYFRLFCGPWTGEQIALEVNNEPNEERVIIFDTPDIVFGTPHAEGHRHDLIANYRSLISVKTLSRTIFVPSQPKNVQGNLSLTTMAEAWQKAWWADIVLTMEIVQEGDPVASLKLASVKNRFGRKPTPVFFRYDYSSLEGIVEDDQMAIWQNF